MSSEITPEQVESLLSDLAYLKEEARALKEIITVVPFEESPPEGLSIRELLTRHLLLQKEYYAPLVDQILFSAGPAGEVSVEEFLKTSVSDTGMAPEITEVLNQIAGHRMDLINRLSGVGMDSWARTCTAGGDERTLCQLAVQIVQQDRILLKELAELVRAFQNEQFTRRNLNQRKRQQTGEA